MAFASYGLWEDRINRRPSPSCSSVYNMYRGTGPQVVVCEYPFTRNCHVLAPPLTLILRSSALVALAGDIGSDVKLVRRSSEVISMGRFRSARAHGSRVSTSCFRSRPRAPTTKAIRTLTNTTTGDVSSGAWRARTRKWTAMVSAGILACERSENSHWGRWHSCKPCQKGATNRQWFRTGAGRCPERWGGTVWHAEARQNRQGRLCGQADCRCLTERKDDAASTRLCLAAPKASIAHAKSPGLIASRTTSALYRMSLLKV